MLYVILVLSLKIKEFIAQDLPIMGGLLINKNTNIIENINIIGENCLSCMLSQALLLHGLHAIDPIILDWIT